MDRQRLERTLADEFGGTAAQRRAVARAARDLSDSGKPSRDRGHGLTVPAVVRHLSDALRTTRKPDSVDSRHGDRLRR